MEQTTEQIINQTVIANRLDSIASEMGLALERSARSPIFAEACDFACCICDKNGDLVSQLSGIPILATAGSYSVISVIGKYDKDISDGDVFIINDPYYGGNHLPDIGIITPVFLEGKLMFFCVSRAHHGDIGGSTAGSYNPKATEIFQEGLRIRPTRIMKEDRLIDDIMDLIIYNTRNPQMIKSDLLAQIGSNRIAKKRIMEMADTYGADTIHNAIDTTLIQAETLTRQRIRELPDGIYEADEYVDDDGWQEDPIRIHAKVTIDGDRLSIDFTGTDAQVKGFINTSIVTTNAASGIAALWVLGADIPRNGGAFGAIEVSAPKGSLLNPNDPAPVTLCTLTPAGEVIAAILKALEQAAPGKTPAGFGRYSGPSFYGVDPRTERFYVGFSFCSLGSGGAMEGMDGKPYMAPMSNYGGVKAPNIESNEVQYPHLTLFHEMVTDTCGDGRFRGGCGLKYGFETYDPHGDIVMFGDGMNIPPYGLQNGSVGSNNRAYIETKDGTITLSSKEYPRTLNQGDKVLLYSSGGGGWGDPLDRDAKQVLSDVKNEYLSEKSAEEVYGVIICDGILNESATQLKRKELSQ